MKPTDELYDSLLSDLFKSQLDEQPSTVFTQAVMHRVATVEKQKVFYRKAYVVSIVVGVIALIAGTIILLNIFLPKDFFAMDMEMPRFELKGVFSSFTGAFSSIGSTKLPLFGGLGVLLLLLGDLFLRRNAEHRKQHEH